MNITTKRLLSLLVVLALTLGLAPVITLPATAATSAAEAEPVRFPSGVESYEAMCPVCKTTATWVPYNGENDADNPLKTSAHLYLDKDQTIPSGKTFLVAYSTTCFNLNGYDITGADGSKYAFAGAGTMRFMDTYGGSVVAGYSANAAATALHANSSAAKYYLYGGTWTKVASSADNSTVVRLSTKGGTINVYEGAVIDDAGKGNAVIIGSSRTTAGAVQMGTFNLRGGLVKGNIANGIVNSATTTYTGCATTNIYSGTLNGSVNSVNSASCTVAGGTITKGVSAAADTTLALSGAPKINGLSLATGVTADISDLEPEAEITVTVTGNAPLTAAREDAAALEGVFRSDIPNASILLGTDNRFYSFCDGVAIFGKDKTVIYDTADEATAAYYADGGFEKGYVLFVGAAGQTLNLSGDAYVDAAGWDVTVTGTGKLYGMDSGNDDFAACAKWTLGENVDPQLDVTSPITGYRYLFAEGAYHRLDLRITHITLRPGDGPDMYYKAMIGCDDTLAKLITGYGTALSVEKMPGKDFAQAEDVKYTVFDRDDFTAAYADNQALTNSCTLTDVLKTDNAVAINSVNAKKKVYANVYLNITLGGNPVTLLADEANAGKSVNIKGFTGIACSLKNLVEGMHNNWSKYPVASRAAMRQFVASWNSFVYDGIFPTIRNDIQVGFGRVDITPDYSVPLAGYGNTHKRMSTGVAERIYATAVAITEESGKTLLLISQDLIDSRWGTAAREAIEKATGVPSENIMVAGTHTHAAPDTASTLDVIRIDYKQDYLAWVVEAAKAALADRCYATAYTAQTSLEKMNSVRHYLMSDGTYAGDNFGSFTGKTIVSPAEEADKQLQAIKFVREGKQDVVMTNWQAHVTYGTGSSSTLISSCFVGITRDHFEENTGDLFVYFTGACGNTNCVSKIDNQNRFSNYTQYSEILSKEVINLTETMDESSLVEFKTKEITFTGQVDHSFEDKLDLAREIRAVYDSEGTSAANTLARSYGFSSVYHSNAVIRRSAYGNTRDMPISVFYLGDISFVSAPYEMFAAHGMYIKENTPGTTFVITSCNERKGYIPTNKAYDYGCYESHNGDFARGTGDKLAAKYVAMLNELAAESTGERKQLSLGYDDRYDVSGKTVNILNAGSPASYQVGTNEKDTAVITLDGDELIATGIGSALVEIDQVVYNITVEAAPISLVMITGHSSGAGQDGEPNYSVVGPAGQVYSSHGTKNLGATTAGVGISYGATVKANNINAFTEAGAGTKGEGSGLAWQWNNLTGEKIWVLNTAVGGSCLPEWIPGETYYENAVAQFQRAQAILENEIKAGHYTLSQMGIFYHNGANFSYKGVVATQSDYETWYAAMWSGFKSETSRDMDGNGKSEAVSFLGLVPIWTISGGISYSSDEPAGLYMAASKEYPEIFTASLIGQNWLTNANVAEKFPEINYTMQAGGSYPQPKLTTDVFASDKVHYQQVAYNALGIDIANNLYARLKAEDRSPELTIYQNSLLLDLTDAVELTVGEALVFAPVTNLNDLTFTASGCIELSYPLQVVATGEGTGTLTISNGSFTKEITFICKNP